MTFEQANAYSVLLGLQLDITQWRRENFLPSQMGYVALLGVVEEVGELAHAHIKELQGIRGTPEEHQAAAKDAIGDIVIYLMDYCDQRGWAFGSIVVDTVNEVTKRDWKAHPADGEKL